MMKKIIAAIVSLVSVLVIVAIGFSAFTFLGEDVIFEYRDGEPSNLSYVTFDYCDANMTEDYKYYFDSNTTFQESRVPLPNVNNAMHQFQGWYLDKQGTNKLNFNTHTFVNGETFYAIYKNTSISSITGSTALNIYNGSPASNPMFFSKYNAIGTMDISKTIDIRYSSSGTYNADTSGTSSATAYRYPNDAKMRIILDCDITISSGGTLQLSSVLGFTAGQNYNGIISSEDYTALDLNGHTITVKNGGKLKAYGIICNSRNSGGIVVESGGEMTTIFCMADFKGGTNLVGSYRKAIVSFTSYSCPYWFCETVFYSGSTLYGETSLCANSSKYTTTAKLIGSSSDALVQLTSGYIIRKGMDFDYFLNRTVDYGNITNINVLFTSSVREKLIFTNTLEGKLTQLNLTASASATGNVAINSLTMTVSVGVTVNVSMVYGDFPITPHMDIEVYSSTVSIGMSLIAMPSSTIFVDENSTLVFKNSTNNSYQIYARLTALDEIPKDFYYLNSSNARTLGSYYLHARLINSVVPAQIDFRGQFSFETGNVDTSSDYKKYSIGGNIKLSTQALTSLRNQQNYVILQSRFYFPFLAPYSAGSGLSKKGATFAMAARYYFSPIISNNKVYFQLSTSDILEGEVYDTNNGLFSYNGDIYFMKYTYRSNTTTAWSYGSTMDLLSENSPPSETEQINKYNNTSGTYTKVDSFGYAVDNTYGQHGFYITSSGQTYCYVNGAYIKATPATGANTVANITGISDGDKFNVDSTQSSAVNNLFHCCQTLTYDYKTERWLWTK